MDGADGGLWSTLARVYIAIGACAVCVPTTAAIPVLVGFDSFFVPLAFGTLGLGLAGGVTYFVDAQVVRAARRLGPDPDDELADPAAEPTRT